MSVERLENDWRAIESSIRVLGIRDALLAMLAMQSPLAMQAMQTP